MNHRLLQASLLLIVGLLAPLQVAQGDSLFKSNNWSNLTSDRKASAVGDILSVVVYQNTEARNSTRNTNEKSSGLNGAISTSGFNKFGELAFGREFTSHGEINKRESFTTRISVVIESVLENGNYLISGKQVMFVNGEKTEIRIRGQIRPEDISNDNQILSTRIAAAHIDYKGSGFVTRSAQPGIINKLFDFLGL